MKKEDADVFDSLEEQMKGMYEEIGLLSKKKPDGPVNKFKLRFLNDLLAKVNQLLGKMYKPLESFIEFSEEDLPTGSDVVFILSQYLKSMDKFRYDNTRDKGYEGCYWNLDNPKIVKKTRRSKFLE